MTTRKSLVYLSLYNTCICIDTFFDKIEADTPKQNVDSSINLDLPLVVP